MHIHGPLPFAPCASAGPPKPRRLKQLGKTFWPAGRPRGFARRTSSLTFVDFPKDFSGIFNVAACGQSEPRRAAGTNFDPIQARRSGISKTSQAMLSRFAVPKRGLFSRSRLGIPGTVFTVQEGLAPRLKRDVFLKNFPSDRNTSGSITPFAESLSNSQHCAWWRGTDTPPP